MQIFMNGSAKRDYAPDEIVASVNFNFHADTYDDALKGGVAAVKAYIDGISADTDFTSDDFKTHAYSVHEQFHTNRLAPTRPEDLDKNLEKRVSDGFFFNQYAELRFDYNKDRLIKLMVVSSKLKNAPRLNLRFGLKDMEEKKRELIAEAYEDAKKKAEALAAAAGKNLRDCVRVEIDTLPYGQRGMEGDFEMARCAKFAGAPDFDDEIKNIDETFKPDDITVTKMINCVWETSN